MNKLEKAFLAMTIFQAAWFARTDNEFVIAVTFVSMISYGILFVFVDGESDEQD